MWHFRIWFSRNSSVGLVVGLDDLRGLFQPMILRFYDKNIHVVSLAPICLDQSVQCMEIWKENESRMKD